MLRTIVKSKIHRATVTGSDLDYEGSLSIDPELMRLADIVPGEQVHVVNLSNGSRAVTYAIVGAPSEVRLNGAMAHLGSARRPGDPHRLCAVQRRGAHPARSPHRPGRCPEPRSHRGDGALIEIQALRGAAPEVVVVGGGVAGLAAALAAAPRARVLVVTKGAVDDGCTAVAQGGIAAAVGPDDSPELHLQDTVAAGRGLCDERAVRTMVEAAPARVAELAAWGVEFDRDGDRVDLHREAAHSRARVLHAGGDATGAAIERALLSRLRESGAAVAAHQTVTRLVVDSAGCAGVELCDPRSGTRVRVEAGAVILASGGAAALWRHTTNPAGSTGDGIALAFEAGADVADLEFLQFHPTVLAVPGAPAFLISEAVRGEGALVVDAAGRRFLLDADPRGELAPRDVVARAIWEQMARSGGEPVFLDCRGVGERLAERFPTVVATCREHGVDPVERPIPIAPAAHYTIGGVP